MGISRTGLEGWALPEPDYMDGHCQNRIRWMDIARTGLDGWTVVDDQMREDVKVRSKMVATVVTRYCTSPKMRRVRMRMGECVFQRPILYVIVYILSAAYPFVGLPIATLYTWFLLLHYSASTPTGLQVRRLFSII